MRQIPALPHIAWHHFHGKETEAFRLQFFLRAITGINRLIRNQLIQVCSIERKAFTLMIRSKFSVLLRPFIPTQRKPFQIFQKVSLKYSGGPLPIRIFDTKNKPASVMFGEEPVEECCPGIPHMKVSRRRRGKSDPRFA
jgi:hypothetical protein